MNQDTLNTAIQNKALWLEHFNRVEIALLLCALVIQLTLLLLAYSRVRSAASTNAARQWRLGMWLLSAGCVVNLILLYALLHGLQQWLKPALMTAAVVYLAIVINWTRSGVAIDDYVNRLWRQLSDSRRAVEEHRTRLDQIVSRRTQALNREIAERRREQRQLNAALESQAAELEFASDLQKALLSPPPALPFACIEVNYQSASEVSGDTYSFVWDDNGVRIVLADAMGHGVSAALITQLVMATSLEMPLDSSASQLFERLNGMIHNNRQHAYVTASWLRLDHSGRLEFCGAGNAPLLIWRAQREELEILDGAGQPLGMFDSIIAPHEVQVSQLAPGDRVVLVTDGLLEWSNDQGEMFGVKGIETVLQGCSGDPLDYAMAGLYASAWEFADMRACSDDVTVIGLELTEAPDRS